MRKSIIAFGILFSVMTGTISANDNPIKRNIRLTSYNTVLFIVIFFIACPFVFGHDGPMHESGRRVGEFVGREGISLGSAIAVVASWSRNKSILWAILHGLFSWLYVIYFAITRNKKTDQKV